MTSELELYNLTEQWIEYLGNDREEECAPLRVRFGRFEEELFGQPAERVVNPLAMQYDGVRNALAGMVQGEDPIERAQEAKELFSEIPNPSAAA